MVVGQRLTLRPNKAKVEFAFLVILTMCLSQLKLTTEDQAILQWDLDNFQQWEKKCEMLIATNKSPIHSEYTINGHILNQTDSAKYLGLNIHKSLVGWLMRRQMASR
jgi:hypothetical protein